MGLSLKGRAGAPLVLATVAGFAAALAACRSGEQNSPASSEQNRAPAGGAPSAPRSSSPAAPTAEQAPSLAAAPSPVGGSGSTTAASAAAPGTPPLDTRGSFLVGTPGESVSLRSLDGQTRTVVPAVSAWTFDPSHGILWFLDEDRLGALDLRLDLRGAAPPATLASGIPEVGAIWVEWPAAKHARFVRLETGCEESGDAVELQIRSKPVLRLVEADRRRSLSRDGARWVQQQVKRTEDAILPAENFDSKARRIALPKGWSGCDDADRCGLSAPFGKGSLRLVLVRDNLGADCFHLGCLLFDSATERFASPPVLVDEGGTPSLASLPARWTSAKEATPGTCGPYLFDAAGTAFLAHRFSCKLEGTRPSATCEELPGEGIGWLHPGAVVGSPG